MTFPNRLRPMISGVAALLLLAGATRAFALASIREVSPEEVRKLGITIKSGPSANGDLRVQMDFQTAGALKGFRWADLELREGGKRLVSAALMPQHPAPDKVHLEFYGEAQHLASSVVTVFSYDGLDGRGYQIRMKDFLSGP